MPTTGRCNCSSITVTLDQLPSKSMLCYWFVSPFRYLAMAYIHGKLQL